MAEYDREKLKAIYAKEKAERLAKRREKFQIYYQEHMEEIRAKKRKYNQEHKEQNREYHKRYFLKNKEKIYEKRRQKKELLKK
jgi:hypothetical protein